MVLESTVDNELPQTLVISNEQSEYAESAIFGEYVATDEQHFGFPIYIKKISTGEDIGVDLYTIRYYKSLGGHWILSDFHVQGTENVKTFEYKNFNENPEEGMFINYDLKIQLKKVIDNYTYPHELCVDGGNEDIRIDNTFAIKEGDDSDKLFNDRRYYTGIFSSESNIDARIVFDSEDDNWKIQYKDKQIENSPYKTLYYSDEHKVSPIEIENWTRITQPKIKDVFVQDRSCDYFDSDILCVVHEVKSFEYNLTGYYYKQDRTYNGRSLYWSMYDLETDPFRPQNKLLQSQIWWQGDYWVLDYRKRDSENSEWKPSKYAFFSFDDVEFPYLVRGWRIFDLENFGKMQTIKPDSCATPTPTKTPTPTETRTPTKSPSYTPSISLSPSMSITPTKTKTPSPTPSYSRSPTFSSFENEFIGSIDDIIVSTYEDMDFDNINLSDLDFVKIKLDELSENNSGLKITKSPQFISNQNNLKLLHFNIISDANVSRTGGWIDADLSEPPIVKNNDKVYFLLDPVKLLSDSTLEAEEIKNGNKVFYYIVSLKVGDDINKDSFLIKAIVLKPTPTPSPSYSPSLSYTISRSYSSTASRSMSHSYSQSLSRSISYSQSETPSFSSFECLLTEGNDLNLREYGEFEENIDIPNGLDGVGFIDVTVDKTKTNVKLDHVVTGGSGLAMWKFYVKHPDTIYDEDEKDKWKDLNSNSISDITNGTRIYYYFKPEHPSVTFGQDVHIAEKTYSFTTQLLVDDNVCEEFLVKSILVRATPTPSASLSYSYSSTISLSYSATSSLSYSASSSLSYSASSSLSYSASSSLSYSASASYSYSETSSLSYSQSASYSNSPSISFSYSYSASESTDK